MTENIKVIIKFKDEQISAKNVEFVESLDATITNVISSINAVVVLIPENKLGAIKANPDVEYVEVDHTATILGFASIFSQTVPWGIDKIRAPEVHKTGNKGNGIKVCVIDTGIDYNHVDLKANYKGGHNFINNTNDPKDDHGHGSHVSGIIAAIDNSEGVLGVAPEASIYALKVLDNNGSGSYSNIISALQWAIDNEMQVVNMSFGGGSYSKALEDICKAANNAGVLLIAAAGNSGSGTDTIGYPAKFSSVVSVGATDSNDKRASFSSTGPDLEISAPGVNIPSTVPKGTCSMCDASGYRNASGTSMACPHIVGTAALVLKANPSFKNTDIKNAINSTSVDLGSSGRDTNYGYGRVDAKAAVDNETPPPPEEKAYKCSGTPNYICEEVPVGTPGSFPTLEECQNNCKKPEPEKRYKCTGAPLYRCAEDPNGKYASLKECEDNCKQSPTETKFDIHVLGSTLKPRGVLAMRSTRGKYNAEQACVFICETLKKM